MERYKTEPMRTETGEKPKVSFAFVFKDSGVVAIWK